MGTWDDLNQGRQAWSAGFEDTYSHTIHGSPVVSNGILFV
ncbi:hypothetical protein RSAG8_05816, partial [Rhizoctonia solani AG-8 WAC10335]